jgi:hypothetical protein
MQPTVLGRVVRSVCAPGRRINGKTNVWYRPLKMDLFEDWLQNSASMGIEDIQDQIGRLATKHTLQLGPLQQDDE